MRPTASSMPAPAPAARVFRRAFALPVVLLLSLVVGVTLAVMLERQGSQTLLIARQSAAVREMHFSRGLREIVDAFLSDNSRRPLRTALGTGGYAGEFLLADGTSIRLTLQDAQGSALSEFTGLWGTELAAARELLEHTGGRPDSDVAGETRRVGPVSVSVLSAPIDLLGSVCEWVSSSKRDGLLETLIELRDDPATDGQALRKIAKAQSLDDEESDRLNQALTAAPRLWRAVIEVRGRGMMTGQDGFARYQALLLIPSTDIRTASPGAQSLWGRRTSVLSWSRDEDR